MKKLGQEPAFPPHGYGNGMSKRYVTAKDICCALITKWSLTYNDGSAIVKRDPVTDRKIPASEEQEGHIKHIVRISFKIADALLKAEQDE